MRDLGQHLERWVAAGLVDQGQADAIMSFEAHRSVPDPASSTGSTSDGTTTGYGSPPAVVPTAERGHRTRGSQVAGAEAVGYVGAALVVGALGRIVAEVWPELMSWGRLTLAGLVMVLAFAAAAALAGTSRVALQRLVSVLLTVGVVATAWLGGLIASELMNLRGEQVAVVSSGSAFVVAVPLYLWRGRALAQATALVATVALALSLVFLPGLDPSTAWVGLLLWGLGAGWLLAGHGGWLPPRGLAGVLGGLLALLGAQVGSFGDTRLLWLVAAITTAGALVALAVYADTLHHLVVGSLGMFVLMPQLVFELFGDAIGAPAALLVVGLLLLLLAVGLGRAGQKVRREQAESPDGSPSDPGSGHHPDLGHHPDPGHTEARSTSEASSDAAAGSVARTAAGSVSQAPSGGQAGGGDA